MARSHSLSCGRAHGTLLALVLLFVCPMVTAPAVAQTGPPCEPSAETLCLEDGRFRVMVDWDDQANNPFRATDTPLSGSGQAVELSDDSGYFWFFEPDNGEILVKVVDGRVINGHFWVFYGATTNVEYTLRVTDTQSNATVTYFNAQGEFTVGQDTRAFEDPLPDDRRGEARSIGSSSAWGDRSGASPVQRAVFRPRESLPSCDEPTVACVQGGRIAIEATVPDFRGSNAPRLEAMEFRTTSTTAILDFFEDDSADLLVKVLDARPVNGSFWIFTGALIGPEVEVRVTDLETGMTRIFRSNEEDGTLAVGDRHGFRPDPPDGAWLETAELPGFRFKTRITAGNQQVPSRQEADCIGETLCISGAIPGRSELFLRMVGPKANGYLWPNIVKFSTSQIEVWIEQLSTGQLNYYSLDAAAPGASDLAGFFDRGGFRP